MQSKQTTTVGTAVALHRRLPAELLSLIINHLDTQSRARLLRVNSVLHALAVKPTYSHLRLFDQPRDAEQRSLPLQGGSATSYAAHVRVVDVGPHTLMACCLTIPASGEEEETILTNGLLGPPPNLRTLRLHLSTDEFEGFLHDDAVGWPCPAVSSLRPLVLVIRGASFRAYEESFLAEPEGTLLDELVDKLEHLVCVFNSESDGDGYSAQSGVVRLIGPQTTSATFIFFHARPAHAAPSGVGRRRGRGRVVA